MRTLLKHTENGHNKQYEVEVTPLPGGESTLRTSYGAIGKAQVTNTATLIDEKAFSEYARLLSEKQKKGYTIVESVDAAGNTTTTAPRPATAKPIAIARVTSDEDLEALLSSIDADLAGLDA